MIIVRQDQISNLLIIGKSRSQKELALSSTKEQNYCIVNKQKVYSTRNALRLPSNKH